MSRLESDIPMLWQRELDAAVPADGRFVRRVLVHGEVETTQETARAEGVTLGDVVVAVRQSAGRGRLGRTWLDTGQLGTAMSFVLPRLDPVRLALGCATATARTVERFVQEPAYIKWPNDIILLKRKVCGILIEQHGENAIVGIGINTLQDSWPKELGGRAISLRQAGADTSRLHVMGGLLQEVEHALLKSAQELIDEFHDRDALTGADALMIHDGHEHQGVIQEIDPSGALILRCGTDLLELPAAAISIGSALGDRIEV